MGIFKSLIKVLIVLIGTFSATVALAAGTEQKIEPEACKSILSYFSLFVLLIPFIVQFFKENILKDPPAWLKLALSWIIGIGFALIAHFTNTDGFESFTIIQTLAAGLGTGLASNGLYDTGLVEKIINFFKNLN